MIHQMCCPAPKQSSDALKSDIDKSLGVPLSEISRYASTGDGC